MPPRFTTMADSTTITVSGRTIIVYDDNNIDCLLYDEIYDPDDPDSGKIFPSLYSRVMKKDGSLWYVSARNTDTYKVTLSPCSIADTSESDVKQISYGNDEFSLYFDNRVSPAKLMVDAKLIFFGNNLVEYTLSRAEDNGTETIVSMYYDSTGEFVSNRVPMCALTATEVTKRYPTNCHTTISLTEGETVILRVFNNLGNQVAQVTLFVRSAVVLNDLNTHTVPITGLEFESPQQVSSDEVYIYEKQDINTLNIRPYLVYADGTKQYVDIDNASCFIFGTSDYIPSFPGYAQTLVLKYLLNRKETVDSKSATTANNITFITKSIKVITVKKTDEYSVKLSVVPLYESGAWKLHWFAYTTNRDHCFEVTDYVTYNTGYEFDGSSDKWGTLQHVEVTADLQNAFASSTEVVVVQALYITVWNPNNYVRYSFRDTFETNVIYGTDSALQRRPIIYYDATLSQFFIPTSIFGSWEAILNSFWYPANAPYDPQAEETIAPTPTYFTFRDSSTGQLIVGGAIPSLSCNKPFTPLLGTGTLTGRTVIMEFLEESSETSGVYNILYGVPVDVVAGTYNDEDD